MNRRPASAASILESASTICRATSGSIRRPTRWNDTPTIRFLGLTWRSLVVSGRSGCPSRAVAEREGAGMTRSPVSRPTRMPLRSFAPPRHPSDLHQAGVNAGVGSRPDCRSSHHWRRLSFASAWLRARRRMSPALPVWTRSESARSRLGPLPSCARSGDYVCLSPLRRTELSRRDRGDVLRGCGNNGSRRSSSLNRRPIGGRVSRGRSLTPCAPDKRLPRGRDHHVLP